MNKPEIPSKSPAVFEIEPGTYYWCQCGRSQNQPYCDGSHTGTDFAPIEFIIDEKKRVALCNCKQTAKSPFCDGSHKKL